MTFPRVSEDGPMQLELDLWPGEPWGGRSPRGLTRVGLGLIFKPQGVRARVTFCDSTQLQLWPLMETRRKQQSRTAPTLLPLPW